MDRIKEQATKFWQTVSAPETLTIYQQAASVTWEIIKELALLIWLVICLVLVAGDWFWNFSIQAGRSFRAWLNSFEEPSADRIASQAGQAIVTASKGSLNFTLSKARTELGLPEPPPKPAPAPKPTPAPKSAPPQPAVNAAPPAPTTTAPVAPEAPTAPAAPSPTRSTTSTAATKKAAVADIEDIDDVDADDE